MTDTAPREFPLQELAEVIIRFAGDSGDGMQLTGSQFTNTSAIQGNDLATFPDFPAEIRAPAADWWPPPPKDTAIVETSNSGSFERKLIRVISGSISSKRHATFTPWISRM